MYNDYQDDYNYSSADEPAGGELAASLSPMMRMDLIQKGYDPMNPADVKAYKTRQKPTGSLSEVAGIDQYKSMGDHGTYIDGKYVAYNDKRDYGMLAKEGKDIVDYDSMNSNVDPRQEMSRNMGGYGNSDVNDRIMSKLEGRRQTAQMSQPQQKRVQQEQPQVRKAAIRQPVRVPANKPQVLTEATKANKLGYTKGIKYINAFIENIKNPSNASRENLILEMNRMVSVEEQIHPSVIQAYRNGIATAERELYTKIKSK